MHSRQISRNAVEQKINESPAFGTAEWTGLGIRKALKWPEDREMYSCSGLVWKMLNDLGFNPGSLPGPDFWLLPNGHTLYEKSCEIEDRLGVAEEDGSAVGAGRWRRGSSTGESRPTAACVTECAVPSR